MGKGKYRNVQCPCGSGKKYKSCCMLKKPNERREMNSTKDLMEALEIAVTKQWITKEEAKDFARKIFSLDDKGVNNVKIVK